MTNKIIIICFSKIKYDFIQKGIDHYFNNIKNYVSIEIIRLDEYKIKNDSDGEIINGLYQESLIIEKLINKNTDQIYLLDINGELIDSNSLSNIIYNSSKKRFVFIVGSSNGFYSEFKKHYKKLSFGKITMPNQLFQVVLLEQIYRGMMIIKNKKYHK